MKKVLIIGASGHAKVVIDILEKCGEYSIAGLIDTYKPVGEMISGYRILGTENDLPEITAAHDIYGGIITIGDNYTRLKMYEKILSIMPDFLFIKAIHPSVIIGKDVVIGDGTVLIAGSIVNSDSKVGKCAIINTKASLGHDCVMGDFTSLAPGVTVGGNTSIGFCTAVSLGANIIQNIKIGDHVIVGAGATVINHIDNNLLVYGCPAKVIRPVAPGEKYLKSKP